MTDRGETTPLGLLDGREPAGRQDIRSCLVDAGPPRPQQHLAVDDHRVLAADPHVAGMHVTAADGMHDARQHPDSGPVGRRCPTVGIASLLDVVGPAVLPTVDRPVTVIADEAVEIEGASQAARAAIQGKLVYLTR